MKRIRDLIGGNTLVDKTFGEKIGDNIYFDRLGAYLICINENKAAVVKTPKGYFLLGGGLDTNENHAKCIQREIIEEIGFTSNVFTYICSAEEYWVHKELGYFHPVQYYYYGELLEKVTEPEEADHKLEWISIDNIENKMYIKSQGWALKYFLENHRR